MATRYGARSMGMESQLGAIEEGQRADVVLFDLATVPFVPLNHPLHQLVYCLPSHSIDKVLVEGELVVDGGELTRVNERDLLSEGNELGLDFVARSEPALELARGLEPSVAAGYRHAVAQNVGVHRHISYESSVGG